VRRLSVLLLATTLLAPGALAQGAAPGQPVPAGHPAVNAQAAPERDAVMPSPDVPAGTLVVRLVNEKGAPLPNTDVKLGILFQKIAEGEQRTEQHQKTDAQGVARFSGLQRTSDFSYRISARSGPAEYASEPIQLKGDSGVLVLLHVYPVTHDISAVSLGALGFVYVETRDDVFQFEVLFRYQNRSLLTWVPTEARMSLPTGFKAFKAGESMGDTRFEEDPGRGVKLAGTFSPGQHNLSFRFQLPRDEESSASFRFGLPPQVAEMRVIAEAAPTMQLEVEGWERTQADVNQNGQRVVVTRRQAKRGEGALSSFTAELSGIPTPGAGRWIAALIAGALAALGFAVFRGKLGQETQADLQDRDAVRAHGVLLDELVALTRARQEGRIGPSSYESARRVLVDALSRIVSQNPGLGKRSRKTGAAKAAKAAKKRVITD
jgi:hypothetical protein